MEQLIDKIVYWIKLVIYDLYSSIKGLRLEFRALLGKDNTFEGKQMLEVQKGQFGQSGLVGTIYSIFLCILLMFMMLIVVLMLVGWQAETKIPIIILISAFVLIFLLGFGEETIIFAEGIGFKRKTESHFWAWEDIDQIKISYSLLGYIAGLPSTKVYYSITLMNTENKTEVAIRADKRSFFMREVKDKTIHAEIKCWKKGKIFGIEFDPEKYWDSI